MPDYKNYPRDVLESCETRLREQGVPRWFIDKFAIADETHPDVWGKIRSLGYQWPIPVVRDGSMTYMVDIADRIAPDLWQTLQLAAVARAWLACFGERSPWELALAYEFAHLDALQMQKWATSSKAGRKRAEKQREALSPRDQQIMFDAIDLIEGGTRPHNLVAELAKDGAYKNPRTGEPLSDRALRNILVKTGVLKAKRKK